MTILELHDDKWTPEPNTGCFIWTGAVAGGGGRPMVSVGNNKIQVVARLICEEIHGPPPTSKHMALHNTPNGCVGGLCVNGAHLRWGSMRDNASDEPAERRREWSQRGFKTKLKNGSASNMRKERWAAKIAGNAEYFSSKPCKRGHTGPFRVIGGCIECANYRNSLRYRR